MKVVYTLRHRLHHPFRELEKGALQEPFEHPGRAEIIRAALAADSSFEFIAPDEWGTGPIEEIHEPGLVRFLESAWQDYQREYGFTHDVVPDMFTMPALRAGMEPPVEPAAIGARLGWWCFETTTPITQGTYDAARSSVDVALTAADQVLNGESVAYGLCRPPGHHAAKAVYGGYCFFNNAAIVAHHLAVSTGARVAVLDVDYHHGNGTQQIFYDRDDVQMVSLHGDPVRAYPFISGFRDEIGMGAGRGSTSNYPLPARTEDDEYLSALTAACARRRRLRRRAGGGVSRPRHVLRRPDQRSGGDAGRVRTVGCSGPSARASDGGVAGGWVRDRRTGRERPSVVARCQFAGARRTRAGVTIRITVAATAIMVSTSADT